MKISIQLTDKEVKGIKAYLASFDDDNSKGGITQYIQGIVSCTINAPQEAVSDYIKQSL